MLIILKRILYLLEAYFEARTAEQLEMKLAAQKEVWLDGQTVKLMLRKGDRTLFTYVAKGKLISKKVGGANFYLESSVMQLLDSYGRGW